MGLSAEEAMSAVVLFALAAAERTAEAAGGFNIPGSLLGLSW